MQQQSQHALKNWLQKRQQHWQDLDKATQKISDKKNNEATETLKLAEDFRSLARDLSLAREILPNSRITAYLELLLTKTHELIHRPANSIRHELKKIFTHDCPQIMQQTRKPILATCYIFVASILAGWLLVNNNPDLAGLIASAHMIEQVQSGKLWTDDLLNIMPSSVLSFSIMSNNIMVTFFAFALGVFFGLGTLYILILNGIMLGGAFAFTAQYSMDGRLFEFVVAHGIVELSVICIGAALGFKLGQALVRPGTRSRSAAFQKAVADAGKVLVVVIPFLVGAGLIEGYISPNHEFSLPFRCTVGVVYFIFFWLVIHGKVWRSHTRSM